MVPGSNPVRAPSWPNGGRWRCASCRSRCGRRQRSAGTIEPRAENLVFEQWARRTVEEITKQLNDVRSKIALPDIEVMIGSGHDWREAVEDVSWETGDLLLLGSGAAGPTAQVFLGSVASKIVRHARVPVVILPRHQTPQ